MRTIEKGDLIELDLGKGITKKAIVDGLAKDWWVIQGHISVMGQPGMVVSRRKVKRIIKKQVFPKDYFKYREQTY